MSDDEQDTRAVLRLNAAMIARLPSLKDAMVKSVAAIIAIERRFKFEHRYAVQRQRKARRVRRG